jgi:hypothetical protein
MKTIEEPLTKQQREELEGIVSLSTQVIRAFLFSISVIFIGIFFHWLQHLVWQEWPLWIIPTVALAVWLYFHSSHWTGGPKLRAKIRRDLAVGNVLISILEPESVEEVDELEDEGPSYIIQTKDGSMYLLTGQDMEQYTSKHFPWSKIGVIETPYSKQFLGLRKMGEPIPISGKRPPLSYQVLKNLGCFQSNFIVLDESKRKLLHAT